ncbi:MAG: exodeoxyribonuclease V subunit gamma [Holophagaceae bacterium]|nr:exodeoxyribonuclease V subunit gamma [Holophagaceae bacterium]
MLRLTYSNRTERLLATLAEALQAEREKFGPWAPIHLVVPNPNVKRYLLDGLSRSLGILANFQVDYLDTLWRRALDPVEPKVRLWNRHAIQGAILSVLAAPGALDAADLAPLKAYLQGEGADLKRIQLSEKAAGLLEDYTLSRPDWAAAWMAGRSVSGAPTELEAWQRGLWTRVNRAAGRGPVRWTTLAQLLSEGAFRSLVLPPRIHVFGLSYVAEVYHRAFEAVAGAVDVHLYSFNPCQEFWDDLPSEAEARRLEAQRKTPEEEDEAEDPFGLLDAADPLLLRRWGRPGRENVRLLNEISGCDFRSEFPDPERGTQLQALQSDLQLRSVSSPRPADGSIKRLACPNAAREAEVVATEIWRLLDAAPADRPLRFSDIAVVVPPDEALRTAYLDHLRTAFDATGRIPLVEVDAPSPATALLLEGAELLLDLPLGRGSRRELLRALTHPAVLARFPDLEPRAWPAWTQAAGIVRGFGAEDLAGETALEPGLLHWAQGLERLALSAFLPPDAAWTEETPGQTFHRPSLAAGGVEALGPFLRHAQALLDRLEALRGARHTPAVWGARLQEYLLERLGGEDAVEGRARTQVSKALERLVDLVPAGLEEPLLTYRQARELAAQALGAVRGEAGGRPHQGVVAGSYAPMRALPFRVVFLMGLGEGLFPAVEERNPLDLRAHRRRAGDVIPAERDRHLFLEMVLGAREALILSHPTEDPLSKEARLPSSLVLDLEQALNPEPGQQHAALTVEDHPRYRFDPLYFPTEGAPALRSLAPAAWGEARARRAGEALCAAHVDLGPDGWKGLALPEPWPGALDGLAAQCKVPPRPELPEVLTIRVNHLRAWLECPVQGTARVRLRLRDETEDPAGLEEEPLASTGLVRALVRRTALLEASRAGTDTGKDLESAYLRARGEAVRRGEAPPGIFGAAEMEADLALLALQQRALEGGRIRLVRVGPATGIGEDADEVHPALDLEVPVGARTIRVRLVGSLQPQVDGRSLFIEKKCGVKEKGTLTPGFRVKVLRAYLDQHLLAALGGEARAHGALCIAGSDDGGRNAGAFRGEVTLEPLTAAAAKERLTAWLGELLATDSPALLPIEEVLKGTADDGPEALREAILERAEDPRDFSAFRTGPLPHAERYPVDPDPAETAQRRLGDFVAQTEAGIRREVP